MDFKFVDIDTDAGIVRAAIPDPDRYEREVVGGAHGWLDKFDRLFISDERLDELMEKTAHLPVGDLPPLISDADGYVLGRRAQIAEALAHGVKLDGYKNVNNTVLDGKAGQTEKFVVLSIDLVASTRLSQSIKPSENARIIQVYTDEMVRACAKFHGMLLKPMADGLLMYFPTGSYIRRNDMAIDAAMTMRSVVLSGINPELAAIGLPSLGCRIGIDSGEAVAEIIGSAGSNVQMDVIGEAVNLAAKIEKMTPSNGICVGEAAAQNVHTMWRKHLRAIDLPSDWSFTRTATGAPYRVFEFDIPAWDVEAP